MVKFAPGELSAVDIAKLALSKSYRTATTPFGRGGKKRYAGKAVSWKGMKKMDGESLDDFIDRIAAVTKSGTFNGLRNAQAMIREYISPNKGKPANQGACLVRYFKTGEYGILPKPAAILMSKAGHGEIIETKPAVTKEMLEMVTA